ncbi:MAG: class I SAM-dependent methyltransferase [Acidobacteriia bacterium]|nr:class I SAM-dependent methyltransferase [Terriglobia bacterium]
MEAEISPCPACENRRFRKRFTKKGRDFWRCTACGLEKQFPLPTLAELRDYYDGSYRDGMYKAFLDAEEIKRLTASQRLKRLLPLARPGRWLDVGCSSGWFVDVACRAGIQAEGIELSATAVEAARQRSLPVFCSTIEDFQPGHLYDTVTGFDILEHVLDPYGFLQSVRRLLAPGGVVCLGVPNLGGLISKAMGRRWYFYIPEEHLHYFNASTIRRLLERAGFRVQHCGRAYKTLTYRYSLIQFQDYNPLIYSVLNAAATVVPERLLRMPIELAIGEMLVTAARTD